MLIALAVVAWFGVLLQLAITLHTAMLNGKGAFQGIISYLGYFTILTNLLVCIALTLPLFVPASAAGRFFSRSDITAGVTNSILFVCLAYHFLLRNVWNPQGWQLLADIQLHYVMPALYLIYWWFYFPRGALRCAVPRPSCGVRHRADGRSAGRTAANAPGRRHPLLPSARPSTAVRRWRRFSTVPFD